MYKLLFGCKEWNYTYSRIKSSCYVPVVYPNTVTSYTAYKDKRCIKLRKFIYYYLCKKCPTRLGISLLRKVLLRGMGFSSTYTIRSRTRRCAISGKKGDLIAFKVRTYNHRKNDGVIQLGETRYYTVSKEWFTCLHAVVICSRMQRYIKHYAQMSIQKSDDTRVYISAIHKKVNYIISYMICVFAMLIKNDRERNKLLLLIN